jgi:hypothetical protein
VKTDSEGNEEWSHIVGDQINYYQFLDVQQTMDGGYVAAGLYYADMFVAKFDENGNICPDCWPGDYGSELPGTDFTDVTMAFEPDTGIVDSPVFSNYSGGDLTTICLEVGIGDITENFFLPVFPNPSSTGIFQIPIQQLINHGAVVVMDVWGRKILEEKAANGISEIDLSTFPKGIYFLEVSTPEQRMTSKLIYQ